LIYSFMKFSPPRSLFVLWLAFGLALLPGFQITSFAQAVESKLENPPAVPAPPSTASAPAEQVPPVEKAAVPAPAAIPTSEAASEPDKPASAPAVVKESTDAEKAAPQKTEVSEPETPKADSKDNRRKNLRSLHGNQSRHRSGNARVSILSDSTLEAGGEADAVVSVLGSSTSAGSVREAVVSVFGSSTSSGDVGEAVVSVFGNTRVTGGTVGEAAVAVLGSNYINGHVKGEVVAVLGNVEFGPNAVVDGEVVCVGGEVIRDPKAILHGNIQNVSLGGQHFGFEWLTTWVAKCLLYGRPLAFGAHLMWAWWVALTYLGIYALIALVAPTAVTRCVTTLEESPGKSILAGFLALLLTPLAYVLMALTVFIVIGVALIPLFTLGLFLAGIFGKVVMLAWFGRRITKLLGADDKTPVVLTVLIGGVIVLLLYTVPVLGFIVYKLLGILGLGVVIYTLLLSVKSNRAAAAKAVPVSSPPVVPPPISDFGAMPAATPATIQPPPVISASTLPRAGFWIRAGASLLDVIMVAVLFGMLNGVFAWFFRISGSFPFWFAVYNITMWATKGTTIGGIICGLRVVRLDDRPIEWGVAIVRGLGAFLSLVVAGLGFIWVAFDDERQSWHDKIAGTTIVQVPKGTSLL
jgi:uncharacterized RDD family membrane protein YckC